MDTPARDDTDAIAAIVKRLARPHPSGGTVIGRPVILAEGARATAILAWIAAHGGAPDSTLPSVRSKGLHSPSPGVGGQRDATPGRYILPAHAFS